MDKEHGGAAREKLGSRLGFILLSAGCAIGIGNVWKFPYMVGQYGGGIFVLFYIIFLAILGVPVLTMEFAVGRASQKSPTKMYQQLEPAGSKWHLHGYSCLIGCYILMMFYSSVSAWMLQYFTSTVAGKFEGMDAAAVEGAFGDMMGDPLTMIVFVAIVVALGFFVCSLNLQKGLEKISKIMMIALLLIMLLLAANAFFMEGAAEGLSFYLIPNFDRIEQAGGIGEVIVAAMSQAFFTLSLGMGSMAIFGSYIGKERALMGEAVRISALDTFVAVVSGLIIFPACFTYGVEAGSGPGLVFVTLPNIFNNIPLGRFWGSLFFLFLTFAALSTVFAVFESIVSSTRELFGWSKKKACLLNGIAMFILSLPCVLGFNLLSFITPFGEGSTIMDLEDFLVSNLLLPLGSLVFVLFCSTRYGWGWKNFVAEANEGKGLKIARWMRPYVTFVLPIVIIIVFVMGLVNFFV